MSNAGADCCACAIKHVPHLVVLAQRLVPAQEPVHARHSTFCTGQCRGGEGQGVSVTEQEIVEMGWKDWEGGGIGSTSKCSILSPFLHPGSQHRATWTCTINLPGTGPRDCGHWDIPRQGNKCRLTLTSSIQNAHPGCSTSRTAIPASVRRKLDWIGMFVWDKEDLSLILHLATSEVSVKWNVKCVILNPLPSFNRVSKDPHFTMGPLTMDSPLQNKVHYTTIHFTMDS